MAVDVTRESVKGLKGLGWAHSAATLMILAYSSFKADRGPPYWVSYATPPGNIGRKNPSALVSEA